MNFFSGWNSTPRKWYSAGPRSRRPTRPTVRLSFTRPASGWTGVTRLPLCVPVTTNFVTRGNPWCYFASIFSALFITCFELFVLCSFSFTGQVTGIRRRWSTTWDRAPDPWTISSGTRQIDWCGSLNISSGAVYWDNVFPSRYWHLEFCGVFLTVTLFPGYFVTQVVPADAKCFSLIHRYFMGVISIIYFLLN